MTPEEIAENIVDSYCMANSDKEGFIMEIAHAILEERESCAKVAESMGYILTPDTQHQPWTVEANFWLRSQNRAIAQAIRDRCKSRSLNK